MGPKHHYTSGAVSHALPLHLLECESSRVFTYDRFDSGYRYLLNTLIAWVTRTTCSVPNLRLLNVILGSVGLPYLVRIILQTQNRSRVRGHLGPPSSSSSSSSSTKPESDIHSTTTTTTTDQTKTESYVITTFPLIFFFSLLYYTDIASLCSVLGCFALGLRGEWGWSSAVSRGEVPRWLGG